MRVPRVASESKIHDRCVWNLSLVLKEIAENSDAVEKELPPLSERGKSRERVKMVTKRGGTTTRKVLVGRPKLKVVFAIVLRLRDIDNLGWSRMAKAYRELAGQYISRDTIKRRYLEAKAKEQ